MNPAEEILNLQYNKLQLIIRALNKTKTRYDAARALGISVRTLSRMVSENEIDKDLTGHYYKRENKKIVHAKPFSVTAARTFAD